MYIRPPCILVGERVLPAVRQAVAKILVKEKGYSQSRAAELLGITQAMVSKYASGAIKRLDDPIQDDIDALAREIAEVLEQPGEGTRLLCSRCLSWRESLKLCGLHKSESDIEECRACLNLGRQSNPRNMVLHTISRAVEMLIDENIVELIPQVRSNIAMCIPDPAGPQDVASVPGRLIVVRGRLVSPTDPEFNASRHTTGFLLRIHESVPAIRSLLNIRHSPEIVAVCRGLGMSVYLAVRRGERLDIGGIDEHTDCIVDEGDFGIEPCIYLLGADALDVARKAAAIHSALKGEHHDSAH
jgi:hypothetical protein